MSDLPESIESDDEKFDKLMNLQDDILSAGFLDESPPKTIEEKYERQITMEKVIQPMFDRIFKRQEEGSDGDVEQG